jgi:hypothetical protein
MVGSAFQVSVLRLLDSIAYNYRIGARFNGAYTLLSIYLTIENMKNNAEIIEDAKKALAEIEFNNRTWKSDFARVQEIWENIAEEINSCKGKKQKFWGLVMDLYHEKYR